MRAQRASPTLPLMMAIDRSVQFCHEGGVVQFVTQRDVSAVSFAIHHDSAEHARLSRQGVQQHHTRITKFSFANFDSSFNFDSVFSATNDLTMASVPNEYIAPDRLDSDWEKQGEEEEASTGAETESVKSGSVEATSSNGDGFEPSDASSGGEVVGDGQGHIGDDGSS